MKKMYLLLLFFFSLSCSKEELVLKCETCFVNMYINGISWEADKLSASIYEGKYVSLLAFGFDSFGQNRETVSFRNGPMESGIFKIVDNRAPSKEEDEIYGDFSTSLSDGDVAGASYDIVPTEDNLFQIGYLNLEEKIVEGQFQMTLVKDFDPDPSLGFPDTVRITRGIFRADIRE